MPLTEILTASGYLCSMNSRQADIRQFSLEELRELFRQQGEPPFRGNQVYDWLWNKAATDFAVMSNLGQKTRQWLATHYAINPVQIDQQQRSADGTVKFGFRLHDGHLVEGVLIPTPRRLTACISSQVGCSLSCAFCATGRLPRLRNLTAAEIYDQVVLINRQAEVLYGKSLTNIVYMGMGEPLLNYREVLRSVELITGEPGLGMAARRITVSTAGIAKMIRQLGDDRVRFNLALSLHAANDVKRSEMMAINDTNSLAELREALKYYFARTKNPVTYEYILFDGFNDSLTDAEELYRFTRHVPCKVNIIEYNPVAGTPFSKAAAERLERFAGYLEDKGVTVKVRRSRGQDIDAACGQLAGKNG